MVGDEHLGCPVCGEATATDLRRLSRRTMLQLGAVGAIALTGMGRRLGEAHNLANALRVRSIGDPGWTPPAIQPRRVWGPDESRRLAIGYDTRVEKLVVHHTATPNDADPLRMLRAIYDYHLSTGYSDVAYNFLIDRTGVIYEGRWAQDYPDGMTPTGEDSYGLNARGGHSLNHNSRSIGIALLGTFTDSQPPNAMLASLVRLLTWKCARWGIDPTLADPYTNSLGSVVTPLNVTPHGAIRATSCPGDRVLATLPTLRALVNSSLSSGSSGYWFLDRSGAMTTRGTLPTLGSPRGGGNFEPLIDVIAHPSNQGYWALSASGRVVSGGSASWYGDAYVTDSPAVGLAPIPIGTGYWVALADGTVQTFAMARPFGDLVGRSFPDRIVAIVPTHTGAGYWLAGADGSVYPFGDAELHGALRDREAGTVVGMARTVRGDGYWLAMSNGDVRAFGHAPFFAGAPSRRSPTRAIIASVTGRGYAIVRRNGHLIPFGDFPDLGDAYGTLTDVVGVAGRPVPTAQSRIAADSQPMAVDIVIGGRRSSAPLDPP